MAFIIGFILGVICLAGIEWGVIWFACKVQTSCKPNRHPDEKDEQSCKCDFCWWQGSEEELDMNEHDYPSFCPKCGHTVREEPLEENASE